MISNDLKKINILYVEDHNDTRMKLTGILENFFSKVYVAKNGEEGLEIYKEKFFNNEKIDLIISDINMPNMNGIEMYEKIKQIHQESICIFITARTETDYLLKAIDLNVEHYLLKPLDLEKLMEKVTNIVTREYYKEQLENKREENKIYLEGINNIATVYTMNREGEILSLNDKFSELSGYSKNDKFSFYDIISTDLSREKIDDVWDIITDNKIWYGDTKFKTKDNEDFYLNISVFKIYSNGQDNFITIGFSTTKENRKKREFQKNVILKVREFADYKRESESKIKKLEEYLCNNPKYKEMTEELLVKNKELTSKVMNLNRQLEHYEKQMVNVNEKQTKVLISKNLEIEEHIKRNKELKIKLEKEIKIDSNQHERIDLLKEQIKKLEVNNEKKLKTIKDLSTIIEDMEEKIKELEIK